MVPLTVKGIEALKAGAGRREISDGRGLYLVVQTSGAMSWAYRYRSPVDGRPRKETISKFGDLTLKQARERAAELAKMVRGGVDPADERRASKAKKADTSDLVDTLLDDFIELHLEPKTKASTSTIAKRAIETIVRPAWGKRKVGTITRRDVISLLDPIARRAPVNANRVHSLVRKFFNFCVDDRAVLEASPMLGLRAPAEESSRDRVLSDDELRLLWVATTAGGQFDRCVRLLLLTGQRRMEVGALRYPELSLAGNDPIWTIPAARTKNGHEHVVPLTAAAIYTFEGINRIDNSEFVFTTDGRVPSSGWSKAKSALDDRMLAIAMHEAEAEGRDPKTVTIPHWTIHDLRRTVASGMARLRQPVHVVEAVLNHRSGTISGVAAVYNRFNYSAEKREALEIWARYVIHLCEAPSTNVLALRVAK